MKRAETHYLVVLSYSRTATYLKCPEQYKVLRDVLDGPVTGSVLVLAGASDAQSDSSYRLSGKRGVEITRFITFLSH